MKKLDLIKAAAEIVVSAGVGSIVGNAIKLTTNPDANRFTRISIAVGGFVLSSMMSDLATKHVNNVIDEVAANVEKILHPSEEKDLDVDLKEEPEEVEQAPKLQKIETQEQMDEFLNTESEKVAADKKDTKKEGPVE